jgi:AcrR family transcriptional regulator
MQELCDADFAALAQGFQKIAEVADPIERLRQIGRAYVAFGLGYPNHYRLMFMTPHPHLESRLSQGNPEEDAYAFLKATVAQAIGAGLLRPEFPDADLVSQMVWAGTHGVVSLHIAKCNDSWVEWRDARQSAHQLIDVMIRGLAKSTS